MLAKASLLVLVLPAAALAQELPEWSSGFAPSGTSGQVHALVRFDDGSGESIFAAGEFGGTSTAVSPGVARWDGTRWHDVGGGLELADRDDVDELRVLEMPGGDVLVAAGSFETVGGEPCGGVAVWDGVAWSRLGDGPPRAANEELTLSTIALFDDGVGPQIWVGGQTFDSDFYIPGTRPYLAYWDGVSWTRVLDGPGPATCAGYYYCDYHNITALEVFDDGNGETLFAAGVFTEIGGVPGSMLAQFDGVQWSQVPGTGPGGITGSVRRLGVHDDGSGARLHLLGSFVDAPATTLLAYDGQTFVGLGAGPGNTGLRTIASLPATAGAPASLWVAPLRPTIQTGKLEMRRWDGTQWHEVNVSMGYPVDAHALESFQGELILGGEFPRPVGVVPSANIARWDGLTWRPVGAGSYGLGTQFSDDSNVAAAEVHDDGSGPALYVAGEIAWSHGRPLTNVVRWNGTSWAAIPGFSLPYLTQVDDLLSVDLGNGPELWMAGDIKVGSQNPGAFASWNGSTLSGYATSSVGVGLAAFDDGGGTDLYLAYTSGLTRYDGSTFEYLGSGQVRAMTVHDDGSGPKLYVGGAFTLFPTIGGVAADNIVRWDGTTWEPVGDGLTGPGGTFGGTVHALASIDDGSGPKLVAGGQFTASGATPVGRVAVWDGTTWSDLGGGVGGDGARVLSLASFADGRGDGRVLYVGGEFSEAGGQPATNLARWDGTSWDTQGLEVMGPVPIVRALFAFDLPAFGGRALAVGGDFDGIDGVPAQRLGLLHPAKRAPTRGAAKGPPAQGASLP